MLVEVHEIGEGDNRRFAVEVWAPILLDVPITDELCRHVALEAKYLWGALRIYQDSDDQSTGMLAMYYVLLGDYLDPEELVMAIHMTAATADGEDDQLQKRFGGRVVDPEGNYED